MWALIGLYLSLLVTCFACGGNPRPSKFPAGTEPERTLWNVCISLGGEVEVPPDQAPYKPSSCKDPKPWKWASLPVKVAIDLEDLAPGQEFDAIDSLNNAVRTWNEWLGHEFFKVVKGDDPDLDVIVSVGAESDYAGLAMLGAYSGGQQGMVFIFAGYETDTAVYAHELGHILGLAHDRGTKFSVMWPTAGEQIPRLTPLDRAALLWLYGLD